MRSRAAVSDHALMPKDADQPPGVVEVLRAAAIWFVIGGLGSMLVLYLLYLVVEALWPASWDATD
jgi:hypothetical protein